MILLTNTIITFLKIRIHRKDFFHSSSFPSKYNLNPYCADIYIFNYLIFGCTESSLSLRGFLFVAVCGLLVVVASLVAEHRLQGVEAQ